MATLYREPLTAEEILRHQNNYENETPAVFVGTWSKYNEGRALAGMWVDLTTFDSYEEFLEFGERLHADEADPELMFYPKLNIIKSVRLDIPENQIFTWRTF